MRTVAWDTWAFVEAALGYARKDEVQEFWQEADLVVTARDIVAETFGFITGKTGGNEHARRWLDAATSSGIRIVDPSFEDVHAYVEDHPGATSLSFADFALALVADQAGARHVATEDRGFRELGFDPVFARE